MPVRMKRLVYLKKCFVLACLALSVCACRPDIEFVENSFRSSDATVSKGSDTDGTVTILFGSGSGTASLELTASRAWTAAFVNDRAKEWCFLSAEEGKRGTVTLTVHVAPNEAYDERSASVLFTCGDARKTIVVTQKQHDALVVSAGRIELPSDGGSFQIEVRANVEYDYAVAYPQGNAPSGWIHATGTKALTTRQLLFQAEANDSLEPREGSVTIRSSLGQEVVHVYQQGEAPALVISGKSVDMAPEGGIFDVQVTSNLDVEIVKPADASWIQDITTKSLSTNTYVFSVAQNVSRSERICQLVFRNETYGIADTVRVYQDCRHILLSTEDVLVPSHEAVFSLRVCGEDPEQYRFEVSDRWIAQERILADASGVCFLFRSSANEGDAQRTAKVRVYLDGFEVPDEVSVVQPERLRSFTYSAAGPEVWAPDLDAPDLMTFVLWGDGTYDVYEPGLVHVYDTVDWHTVLVEGRRLTDIQFGHPADGMHLDFSDLHK